MYKCTYTSTNRHEDMYCTLRNAHLNICPHTRTYSMYTCTHACMPISHPPTPTPTPHTCANTQTHIHTSTYVLTHTHTTPHAHTYTCTHMHLYTQTRTHTQAQTHWHSLSYSIRQFHVQVHHIQTQETNLAKQNDWTRRRQEEGDKGVAEGEKQRGDVK